MADAMADARRAAHEDNKESFRKPPTREVSLTVSLTQRREQSDAVGESPSPPTPIHPSRETLSLLARARDTARARAHPLPATHGTLTADSAACLRAALQLTI